MQRGPTICLVMFLLGVCVAQAPALEPTEEQKKQVKDVSAKLLAKMKPVDGLLWPPDIQTISDEKAVFADNAYASIRKEEGKKLQPYIRITGKWLQRMQGDPDMLAHTLGHELGHIHHKHTLRQLEDKPQFVQMVFSQSHEFEADAFGAKLMKDAGYSLINAVRRKSVAMQGLTLHNAAIKQLLYSHPAWDDRFGRVVQHPGVWEAMATFNIGVALLSAEQHFAAERCFEQVTRFDPHCHEAWLNRGYAQLMQYCDNLSTEELKSFGVGQVLCGAFYERAKSLQPPIRGKDGKLWKSAITSLNAARKLKDSPQVRFNLGLAYLLHPDGKDVKAAQEHWQEALVKKRDLDPLDRVAIRVNLGVALLEGSTREDGRKQLAAAREELQDLPRRRSTQEVALAIRFNEAMDLATTDAKGKAADALEAYLKDGNELSAWWAIAFGRYTEICKDLQRKPATPKTLQSERNGLRPQLSVTLRDGKTTVTLGEKQAEVLKRLGKPSTTSKILGESLQRYRFAEQGIDVLATDRVVAILLTAKQSPALQLKPRGPGVEKKDIAIRVGMSLSDLQTRVPAARAPEGLFLLETGAANVYSYSRELGVAIRSDGAEDNPVVTEIVVVQAPVDGHGLGE